MFARPLDRDFKNVRVAWCPDLGGLPLDRRVRSVLAAQRQTFADLGCIVEDAVPDLSGADEVFLTLRAWNYYHTLGPLLDNHRDEMKPEAVWQIEAGRDLTGAEIAKAMNLHGELMQRMRRFQEKFEFLICAVNQVPPFDASIEWPREVEGVKMENYLDWMKSAYRITSTFCPAISVPAGFTEDGLPVGIQIVGRYRDDLGVLQLAHAFEQVTGFGRRRPAIAMS
jgi:amidase